MKSDPSLAKRLLALAASMGMGIGLCIPQATAADLTYGPFSTIERVWVTDPKLEGGPSFASLQDFIIRARPQDSVLLTVRETPLAYAAAYRTGGNYLVIHCWHKKSRRAGVAPPLAPWCFGLVSSHSLFSGADYEVMTSQVPWGIHFMEEVGKERKVTALYPMEVFQVAPDFKGFITSDSSPFLLDQNEFPPLLVEWPGPGAAERALAEDVAKIESSASSGATRLAGLKGLVHKAGVKLYQTGSMIMISGNPRVDAYEEKAMSEIRRVASPELIMLSLKSEDRQVRLWGTTSFGWPQRLDWKDALPEFMVRAVLEPDSGLRAMVVERLKWFPETRPFLQELIDSEKESSPWVWARLDFNVENINSHASFNRRAEKWLASPDEAVRLEWLQWIGGQASANLAPMFRVLWRGPVEDRIRGILAHPASAQEREAAEYALKVFEKK